VAGALATGPVDSEVLRKFFSEVRPFGLWGSVRRSMGPTAARTIVRENLRDVLSWPLAVGWQLGLFLAAVYLVFHNWPRCLAFLGLSAACGAGLYFSWYRHLAPHEKSDSGDG